MKFAILIYNDPALLGAIPATKVDGELRRCFEQAGQLREQGILFDSQMLEDAATAKSVRVRNGRRTVVDGPFAETNELLAGFNLIEADSMEEAVRIASEFPWVNTGCVEVREIKDIDAERTRVSGAGQDAKMPTTRAEER